MIWDDLADSELRRRLVQRGVDLGTANLLIARRDTSVAAARISELLRR